MDMNRKDLLFYSNYCEHCKNLIGLLVKKNLRDNFILVCVDKKELKIPPFIDRVPSILTVKKELYTDDGIYKYVDAKMKSMQQKTEDIAPFALGSAINSSQYTFITADGEGYDTSIDPKGDMMQSHNFVLLSSDQRIIAPLDRESESKSNKFDSSLLERYMDARKTDDDMIKKLCQDQQKYGPPPRR